MKLLLDRDQRDASLFSLVPLKIGSGVTFTLHAELELDAEEEALIKKYKFAQSALVVSDPIEDIKQSFRPALLLGFLTFVVVWFVASFVEGFSVSSFPVAILGSLIVSVISAIGNKFV